MRLTNTLAAAGVASSLLVLAASANAAAFTYSTLSPPTTSNEGVLETAVNGINNSGETVGLVIDSTGSHAFLDTLEYSIALNVPNGSSTIAYGINDVDTGRYVGMGGEVVGSYIASDSTNHGFLRSSGNFTTIDVPGASSTFAQGINNAGQIVGIYQDRTGTGEHGFLYSGGSFTTLDVPGAIDTLALGINNAGKIVGSFDDAAGRHGFLYNGSNFTQLDEPNTSFSQGNGLNGVFTQANGINDAGQIVGYFVEGTRSHGFLDAGGDFTQLDVPGAADTLAYGINDAGVPLGDPQGGPAIVGNFSNDTGLAQGFLAIPTSASSGPASAVPEPSSLALFSVGLLGLHLAFRRRAGRSASRPPTIFASLHLTSCWPRTRRGHGASG